MDLSKWSEWKSNAPSVVYLQFGSLKWINFIFLFILKNINVRKVYAVKK